MGDFSATGRGALDPQAWRAWQRSRQQGSGFSSAGRTPRDEQARRRAGLGGDQPDRAGGQGAGGPMGPGGDAGLPRYGLDAFYEPQEVPTERGVGFLAYSGGGPVHLGCVGDKHTLGSDNDGHPINGAHLSVYSLFYYNAKEDACLDFDVHNGYPEHATALPIVVEVYLAYDPASDHAYFPTGRKPGLWRWYSTSAEAVYEPPTVPPPPTTQTPPPPPITPGPPGRPTPITPNTPTPPPGGGGPDTPTPPPGAPGSDNPQGPGNAGNTPIPPGSGSGGDPGPGSGGGGSTPAPGSPAPPPVAPGPPPPLVDPGPFGPVDPGKYYPGQPGVPIGPPIPPTRPRRTVQPANRAALTARPVSSGPMERGVPSLVFRPQFGNPGTVDLRYSPSPDPYEVSRQEAVRPGVLRLAAVGAQDGLFWAYTQRPQASTVYGGTAPGVLQVLPPELDTEDLPDLDAAATGGVLADLPSGISRAYLAFADGTGLAFGHAKRATGGLYDGAVRVQRGTGSDRRLTVSQQLSGAFVDLLTAYASGTERRVAALGTSGFGVPSGTTAQRDATPFTGQTRWNSTLGTLEVWTGAAWTAALVRADGSIIMTGDLNMGGHKVTLMGDPTGAQDAATKFYVDSVAQGLTVKAACRAATTANTALAGLLTIDGVTLVAADRVLVKNQTLPENNGIYVAAAGAWSRALDMDSWTEVPSAFTFITQGTANAETGWVCTSDAGLVLGTDAINWSQFSGGAAVFAATILRPAQITASQNDYDPGSYGNPTFVFLTTNGPTWTITGLKAGSDGAVVVLINANVSTDLIPLARESVASAAANRFSGPTAYALQKGECIWCIYDGTNSRWRWAGPPSSAAAAIPSLRGLGTAALTACEGNDARLSDTRTPTDGSVTKAKLSSQDVVDVKTTVAAGVTSTVDAGYCRVVAGLLTVDGTLIVDGLLLTL